MTATEPPARTEDQTSEQIAVQRELERLRQERETFNQLKSQDQTYYGLRVAWGIATLVVMLGVFVLAVVLLATHQTETLKGIAAGSMVADVLAAAVGVQKIVLFEGSTGRLQPVTPVDPQAPAQNGKS